MNCSKGICKYLANNNICMVDNSKCDYTSISYGIGINEEHCHQESNPELQEVHHDCFLLPDAPLEPFFSCYHICKYYFTCDKT